MRVSAPSYLCHAGHRPSRSTRVLTNPRTWSDRVETEALRAEFSDAVMLNDYERLASLFTSDGVWRMPDIPAELIGQEQIRSLGRNRPAEYLIQTTHPGSIEVHGDTATGRAHMQSPRASWHDAGSPAGITAAASR